VVLGLVGYFGEFSTDFVGALGKVLTLGIQFGAAMVLLPRMVQILMEGLIPVSAAARDFMSKRASGREVNIGLDAAVLVGHPSAISTGLLLAPIAILLSIILPGNRMILFADLAVLPFLTSQIAPMAKGNIIRMVFVGTFLLIFGFYFANAIAPVITEVAGGAGFAIPDNAVLISSVADGFVWTPLAFMALGKYTGWIGILLFAVLTGVLFFFYKKNEAAWDKLAGAKGE
jgi:PTS system galactitol-specific IIC component